MLLSPEQEDGGDFGKVRKLLAFPLGNGVSFDPLVSGRDAGSDAETCLRAQGLTKDIKEFLIAIRSLYKELCLMLLKCAGFQLLQSLDAICRIDGQVTVKGKTLSVQARCHHRQNHGRRPHKGNYTEAFTLGYSHHVSTRVCNSRATRLGDDADILTCLQWLQILRKQSGIGVLAHGIKRERININLFINTFEETTCRAHFLDNKMPDTENHFTVIGWQYAFLRRVTQFNGNEKQSGHIASMR